MGKIFLLLVAVLNVLILINFLPLRQESYHCIKPVGISIRVAKFGVNYGVGLSIPQAPDKYVTPCLQTITPMKYLTL